MKKIVFVDAFSSGNLYAPESRERGYECVHVQSSPIIPSVYLPSFKPEDFVANVVHEDSLESTLKRVSSFSAAAIIPGAETGVMLADELSERLGLASNGTSLSEARRDKYLMAETIRSKGVPAVEQLRAAKLEDILAWVNSRKFSRCVLKPLDSAGTDGVHLCRTTAEIETAFHAIAGHTNKLGLFNKAALAQEFLAGTEYIVDTVSCAGKHYVTDIWEYHKKETDGTSIYDFSELLPAEGAPSDRLTAYAFKVLDALGIRVGCGHLEIMDTPRGPILVEMGARPCGSATPIIVEKCTGQSQIDVALDSYLDAPAFTRKSEKPYVRTKQALFVYFISERDLTLDASPDTGALRSLSSYSRHQLNLSADKRVHRTKDIFTAPGWVELIHEDRTTLYKDYARVRALEKTFF